jgi:vacuolar-type H+-ATPase subunit I/STV1
LTGISCASVRGAMRVQNVFTVAKLMALFIVIVLGLAELFAGFVLSYCQRVKEKLVLSTYKILQVKRKI